MRVAVPVTLICLAGITCPAPAVLAALNAGQPAPLTAPITVQTLEGRDVLLAEQVRGATMLVFWAGWCGPCIREIAELNELHAWYGPKGLKVIGLGVREGDETLEKIRQAATKHRIAYPVLFDAQGTATKAFELAGVPASFLIDVAGMITWQGAMLPADINDRIKRALSPGGERGQK